MAVLAEIVRSHKFKRSYLSITAELFGAAEKFLATSSDMHRDASALAALHCSLTSPCASRVVFTLSSPLFESESDPQSND